MTMIIVKFSCKSLNHVYASQTAEKCMLVKLEEQQAAEVPISWTLKVLLVVWFYRCGSACKHTLSLSLSFLTVPPGFLPDRMAAPATYPVYRSHVSLFCSAACRAAPAGHNTASGALAATVSRAQVRCSLVSLRKEPKDKE